MPRLLRMTVQGLDYSGDLALSSGESNLESTTSLSQSRHSQSQPADQPPAGMASEATTEPRDEVRENRTGSHALDIGLSGESHNQHYSREGIQGRIKSQSISGSWSRDVAREEVDALEEARNT
ncbi:unnamed protein product [Closterium sp. Yama58-4]|nr:unnamed protein product [Closterium sp. Yama58-4]